MMTVWSQKRRVKELENGGFDGMPGIEKVGDSQVFEEVQEMTRLEILETLDRLETLET
jgi:hypothetical protein